MRKGRTASAPRRLRRWGREGYVSSGGWAPPGPPPRKTRQHTTKSYTCIVIELARQIKTKNAKKAGAQLRPCRAW